VFSLQSVFGLSPSDSLMYKNRRLTTNITNPPLVMAIWRRKFVLKILRNSSYRVYDTNYFYYWWQTYTVFNLINVTSVGLLVMGVALESFQTRNICGQPLESRYKTQAQSVLYYECLSFTWDSCHTQVSDSIKKYKY